MDIKRPESKQPIPENAKLAFKGIIFDVYQWDQKMFDGTTQTYERLKRPDTVTIIPIIEDGKIILLDEEQPGRKPYISVPGGKVYEGEDPLSAAKRELLEETGYEAKEYVLWGAVQPVGKIDWVIYTFIAKGCKQIADPQLESGEKIVINLVNFNEFMTTTSKEEFRDDEIKLKVMEAKINPEKMNELKRLFS